MTIRALPHTFAVLIVTLTFSIPFTTLAQQKSVQTEISEILEIKVAAERDASNDINRFAWFGAGLGIAYVGGGVGGVAGCLIGENQDIVAPYFNGLLPGRGGTFGLFVGGTAGILLPIISIFTSPVHVPARRLTGKSPEYVEIYADAYQKKIRLLKTKWTAAGTATGCVVSIVGCLIWTNW